MRSRLDRTLAAAAPWLLVVLAACSGNKADTCTSLVWSYDQDGDGYRSSTYEPVTSCTAPVAPPAGCTSCPASGWRSGPSALPVGDCDDANAAVHPGATDVCDGLDNDCNGAKDPGCACVGAETRACGPAADTGECAFGVQTCAAGAWGPCVGAVMPAAEICDGLDNDCDGLVDEGCDDDHDGYCDAAMTVVGTPAVCPHGGGDCDDTDASIHPGATDVCDGVDNDCDGAENPTCQCTNGDTRSCGPSTDVGACTYGVQTCAGGAWGACVGAVMPATEICDGLDNDCDGLVDEGCDDDHDGYCDAAMTVVGTPAVCPHGGGDCNDSDASIHPGATETCNGKDDDCNSAVDDAPWKFGVAAAGTACYAAVPLPASFGPNALDTVLAHGDGDFAGHGPRVATSWDFEVVSGHVEINMGLTALELVSDYTQMFGLQKKAVLTSPYDGKIAQVLGTERSGMWHATAVCGGSYAVPNFPQFADWHVVYVDDGSSGVKNGFFQFPDWSCGMLIDYSCLMNTSGSDWGETYCTFASDSGNVVWVRRVP